MLSAFCAKAVPQRNKIAGTIACSHRPVGGREIWSSRLTEPWLQMTGVRRGGRATRRWNAIVSTFWVIFINLTSSFWVCASVLIPARTASHSDPGGRACIDALLLDPFYGVQGKFLKIFRP